LWLNGRASRLDPPLNGWGSANVLFHQALTRVLDTDTFRVFDVEPSLVDRAIEQFQEYDDQSISLTDHVIAIQADDHGIAHVFSYDGGFRTLGFSTLPRET